MRQSTLDYLKRRYLALEKEIEAASPYENDLTIADLQYRKLVIADEIETAYGREDALTDREVR